MAGFKKPDVVFVSKGEVQKDWQARSTIMSATMAATPNGGESCIFPT
jgi:hypothetical protein